MTHRFFFLLLLVSAVFVGCSDIPVAEDLSHGQAREIVATLSRKGVSATFQQTRKGSGRYRVTVASNDFSQSVQILDEQDLPEKPREAFLESLSTHSFLPDSRAVESLRLDYALALQLEELIENLPGVIEARAVVRYHLVSDESTNEKKEESKQRAASLVIRSSSDTSVKPEEVQQIVNSIIPGLAKEHLHLSIHTQAESVKENSDDVVTEAMPLERFLFGWRVVKEDYFGLAISILGLMCLFGLAGALAGYWFGFAFSTARDDSFDDIHELSGPILQVESKRTESLPEVPG